MSLNGIGSSPCIADALYAGQPQSGPALAPSFFGQASPANHPAGPVGPGATSFQSQVAGQQAQPIDLELAELSAAVYDPSIAEVAGWTRVSDEQLRASGINPGLLDNADTGFRAAVYEKDGQYVLAFAGSDPKVWNRSALMDWVNNAQQAGGWASEQYD